MKRTRRYGKRTISDEDDFVNSCRSLWSEFHIPWGLYLNKKQFHLYEQLLVKFSKDHEFTEEVEEEAKRLWEIENSPLMKALKEGNEED